MTIGDIKYFKNLKYYRLYFVTTDVKYFYFLKRDLTSEKYNTNSDITIIAIRINFFALSVSNGHFSEVYSIDLVANPYIDNDNNVPKTVFFIVISFNYWCYFYLVQSFSFYS